jgi:hypothetical protein
MFNLLSPVRVAATGSSTSLSELDHAASLKDALDGLDALLNDDLGGIPDNETDKSNCRSGENSYKWDERIS